MLNLYKKKIIIRIDDRNFAIHSLMSYMYTWQTGGAEGWYIYKSEAASDVVVQTDK